MNGYFQSSPEMTLKSIFPICFYTFGQFKNFNEKHKQYVGLLVKELLFGYYQMTFGEQTLHLNVFIDLFTVVISVYNSLQCIVFLGELWLTVPSQSELSYMPGRTQV